MRVTGTNQGIGYSLFLQECIWFCHSQERKIDFLTLGFALIHYHGSSCYKIVFVCLECMYTVCSIDGLQQMKGVETGDKDFRSSMLLFGQSFL